MSSTVALVLAVLVGLSLGLLGSGGSIVRLPILTYVAGIPVPQAVGMSLVVVGGTSLLGSLLNLRRGSLDPQAAGFFALSGALGALLGARLTHLVSPPVLLLLFGALMLIVGTLMLLRTDTAAHTGKCRPPRCLIVGLSVGILTGFLGVGGGFVILPALVLFAGLEIKRAIGTSLAVIAVNCFAGLLGQLRYVNLDWPLTLAFLAAAMLGMLGGLALASRLPSQALRVGLGWIIVGLGAFLLAQNLLKVGGLR